MRPKKDLSPQEWFVQHLLTTTKPSVTIYFRDKSLDYVERFLSRWNERYPRQLYPLHYNRDREGISVKCSLGEYNDG